MQTVTLSGRVKTLHNMPIANSIMAYPFSDWQNIFYLPTLYPRFSWTDH